MKKISILLIFLAFLAFCAYKSQHTGITIYYIAAAGNDNNDGKSEKKAWKSIDRANKDNFMPGDKILLKGGEIFIGSMVLDSTDKTTGKLPITIGSYGKGRAIITPGDSTAIVVRNLGNVIIENLILKGNDKFTNKGSGLSFENTLAGNIKLIGINICNIDASRFGYCGIFIGGKPDDKGLSGYSGVVTSYCDLYDNLHFGMLVSGHGHQNTGKYANNNFKVDHCKFYNNSGDPNFLENHSGSGICIDNMENGVIEHCIAYNNGYLCNSREGGPVGIWFHAANKCVIQYCASFNNRIDKGLDGGGFDFDAGVTNSIMQYNYSSNNDGPGYLVYTYAGGPHSFSNNTIRYNVSENDGRKNSYAGIWIKNDGSGIKDLDIHNNTIIVKPQEKGSPSGIFVSGTQNVRIWNNNIVSTGGVPLVSMGKNQSGLEFRSNNYWSTDNNFNFSIDVEGYFPNTGKFVNSIKEWQKLTGVETHNDKPSFLSVNPLFERMNALDTIYNINGFKKLDAYRLTKKSRLIDAGIAPENGNKTKPINTDILGTPVPQGKAMDIGAYEYVR